MKNRSQRSALVIMEALLQPLLKACTYPLSLRFFLKDEPVSPLLEDWSPRSSLLPLFPFTLLLIQQVYIEASICQIPCYTLGGRQKRSPICTHSFFPSGLYLRPLLVLSEASWYPSGLGQGSSGCHHPPKHHVPPPAWSFHLPLVCSQTFLLHPEPSQVSRSCLLPSERGNLSKPRCPVGAMTCIVN